MDLILSTLLDKGLLDANAIERARTRAAEGSPIEEAILSADGLSEDALLRVLAETFDVPFIDLETRAPSKEFLATFPAGVLVRHQILPIEKSNGITLVAACRLSDTSGLDELRLVTGREVALALAPATEIDRC